MVDKNIFKLEGKSLEQVKEAFLEFLKIDKTKPGGYASVGSNKVICKVAKEACGVNSVLEIKKAETTLKDKLIQSGSYYEELVLRDRAPRNIDLPEEYIRDFDKHNSVKNESSPLADIFGVNLDKEDINDKVVDFLYRFSGNLPWTEEDKEIWRLRFIENKSPVEVAESCHRARSWLDTRYSRLNKKFKKAIREWWRIHS